MGQPLIGQMIKGDRIVFTPHLRKTVTILGTKTAITNRCICGPADSIPRQCLNLFYRGIPEPPLSVSITLARNAGPSVVHGISRPFKRPSDRIPEVDGERFTFVIGELVMQVTIVFDFQGIAMHLVRSRSPVDALRRVWPDTAPLVGAVSFPPSVAMFDPDVEAWAHSPIYIRPA